MKKRNITRTFSILLSAAMLLTALPVSASDYENLEDGFAGAETLQEEDLFTAEENYVESTENIQNADGKKAETNEMESPVFSDGDDTSENLPLLVLGGNEGVKSPQNSIAWYRLTASESTIYTFAPVKEVFVYELQ